MPIYTDNVTVGVWWVGLFSMWVVVVVLDAAGLEVSIFMDAYTESIEWVL
jgi:hypothetical protein